MPTVEHSSSTPGRTTIEHSSSMSGRSTVEHSSSASGKPTIEHSSSTPCRYVLLVEHATSTPTEFTRIHLDELASVLKDQQPHAKTTDKATQAPEKHHYVCYVCGHEAVEQWQWHMLSNHQMDLVGIAVVYDDDPCTNYHYRVRSGAGF